MATAPIVLVPGFWLGAWAWDDVADALRADGHDVTALTLPGLESADADRSNVTLSDHVDAIVETVEAKGTPVVLAVHSGSGAAGYAVTDRVPDKIAAMVYVDSGPATAALGPDTEGADMIEPWLADRALLIVDDTDWNDVERATRDYLEQQPRARLLVWIPGKDNGYPAWWEGVKVLAWEADSAPTLSPAEAEAVVQLGLDPA